MELGFVEDYRRTRLLAYRRFEAWVTGHETLYRFGAALLLALATGALAQVAVYTPLSPVPYTLQVVGVVLMGSLLGSRWGATSAALYLGLGLVGLPVYAGQLESFAHFRWFSGLSVFARGLSAGYLLGFVLQAYLVGLVVDRRSAAPDRRLASFSTVAIAGLVLFGLLDVYFLANYATLYPKAATAFPNAWFLILCAGLVVLVGGAGWLALTSKARRERIELFMGNVAGLLVLYAVGAAWFYGMWRVLGYGPLDGMSLLRYTVLPFIPADLTKILLCVGVVTLARPTRAELRAAHPEAPPQDV